MSFGNASIFSIFYRFIGSCLPGDRRVHIVHRDRTPKDWLGNGIKEPEASGGKSRTQKRRRSNQRRNHHGNALLDAESSGIYGDVAIKRSSTWRRLLRPRSTRFLVCPADISWIKRAFVFRLNVDWPIYGITQGFRGLLESFVWKEMSPTNWTHCKRFDHIVDTNHSDSKILKNLYSKTPFIRYLLQTNRLRNWSSRNRGSPIFPAIYYFSFI